MSKERGLDERIADAERKVEDRRVQVSRHWHQALGDVRKATSWWPAAAVAALFVAGIVIGRSRSSPVSS